MAATLVLEASACNGRVGSSPTSRTKILNGLPSKGADYLGREDNAGGHWRSLVSEWQCRFKSVTLTITVQWSIPQ